MRIQLHIDATNNTVQFIESVDLSKEIVTITRGHLGIGYVNHVLKKERYIYEITTNATILQLVPCQCRNQHLSQIEIHFPVACCLPVI